MHAVTSLCTCIRCLYISSIDMTLLVQKELFIRSFCITVVCLYRSGKIRAITYGLPQRTPIPPMCKRELNTITLQPAVIVPEEPRFLYDLRLNFHGRIVYGRIKLLMAYVLRGNFLFACLNHSWNLKPGFHNYDRPDRPSPLK